MNDHFEVLPLGGIGEFGMNCTVLRYADEMILIDAGITFPSGVLGTELGVETIVPNISFLRENRQKLQGILLTHGHEDHIGSVPYVINEIPVPIFATALTLELVREKLRERQLLDTADLRQIEARQVFTIGAFTIDPIHVAHSFPDALGFAISTSSGCIIWTGDFKFDQTPIDGKVTDMVRLSEYGEKGVLALFSDSTNSEVPGLASSEFTMYEVLRNLFAKAKKKIIVGSFSSSIHRIQIILDLAKELGRKVAPIGRSMISNIRIAANLNYLHIPSDLLISASKIKKYPSQEILILATGTQGEPRAALSRMAVNELKRTEVEEGDLIIISARIIPGNEKLVANMTNHFYKHGAQVYDSRTNLVHASGHGHQDDLKLMINLTRPKFFVPIHGEFRQLKNHTALAQNQGIPADHVTIIENGDILRLTRDSSEIIGQVTTGRRFIDKGISKEVHEIILRDRHYLSEDGFVVLVLPMNSSTGELTADPEMVSRGFVLMDTSEELIAATLDQVKMLVTNTSIEKKQDQEIFKEILRSSLKRFLRKQTGKRPIILPVIVEIELFQTPNSKSQTTT